MTNPRLLLAALAIATPGALLAVDRAAHGSGAAAPNAVKRGVDLWQVGDGAGAVAAWRPAADAGDADAQFDLAQAYKLGRGVPLDMRQAEGWYRRAALQGHDQAQATLGLILFQNGDRAGAMPWLKQAADKGEPRAQYVYGTALFNGDTVDKDWPRAYAMMTRAAAAGLPQAKTSLAQMDQFMPMAQRQQGTALAASVAPPAAATPPAPVAPPSPAAPRTYAAAAPPPSAPPSPPVAPLPPRPVPARPVSAAPAVAVQAPIRTAPLPPSRAPETASASAPARAAPPPTRPAPAARATATITPAAPRATAARAASTSGGSWRIQLGAFQTAGAAQAQWRMMTARAAALRQLQPFYVRAGAVTRLQAGSFASHAAASEACRSAGGTCFPVGS